MGNNSVKEKAQKKRKYCFQTKTIKQGDENSIAIILTFLRQNKMFQDSIREKKIKALFSVFTKIKT